MKYSQFNVIYEANKELDDMFESFHGERMHEKNKLELITEISEFANETRHFKYWSNKKMDMDKVCEEYADCLVMVLYFFHRFNISLDDEFNEINDCDYVDMYIKLYKLAIYFLEKDDVNIIKEFFVTLIKLGYMTGLTDDDIIEASLQKIKRTKSHFGGL